LARIAGPAGQRPPFLVRTITQFLQTLSTRRPDGQTAALVLANVDWNEDIARQAYHQQYWTGLVQEAQDAMLLAFEGGDDELQQAVQEHSDFLPDNGDIPEDSDEERDKAAEEDTGEDEEGSEVIAPDPTDLLIARFLHQLGSRRPATAREAALFLAHADFDLVRALGNYHEWKAVEENEDVEGQDSSEDGLPDIWSLNPHVDRTKKAVKGRPDPAMFTIVINYPGRVTKKSTWSGSDSMDWTDEKGIRALNKWRNQIFLRALGRIRGPAQKFELVEKKWLIEYHENFATGKRMPAEKVDWSKLDWDMLAESFNKCFKNRVLPGQTQPRQGRTARALHSEAQRIKELTDFTGQTARSEMGSATRRGRHYKDPEEEDEKGSEEADEEQQRGDEEDKTDDDEEHESAGKGMETGKGKEPAKRGRKR